MGRRRMRLSRACADCSITKPLRPAECPGCAIAAISVSTANVALTARNANRMAIRSPIASTTSTAQWNPVGRQLMLVPMTDDDALADPLAWRPLKAPTLAEFEVIATEAFRRLPLRFRAKCEGVVIHVE